MTVHNIIWEAEPDLPRLQSAYQKVHHSNEEAIMELTNLAEEGSLAATMYLADIFNTEHSSAFDKIKAAYWYSQAAQLGFPPALYMLGRDYFTRGEISLAIQNFEQAAKVGYAPASYRLARIYFTPPLTPERITLAKSYFEAARRSGHVLARRDLGILMWQHPESLWDKLRAARLIVSTFWKIASMFPLLISGRPIDKEQFRF